MKCVNAVTPHDVDGVTPLESEEVEQLIPSHIESRAELNAWEQRNIAAAVEWLHARRPRGPILTLEFLKELHRRMFDETWLWAGKFRTTEKNIGVPVHSIQESLHNLLDDVTYWLEHGTYSEDEICIRLHHRLVHIHPFPNGNGRHGRLMVDALREERGLVAFTWGSGDLVKQGSVREAYMGALRAADAGDYDPLSRFVYG